MQTNLKPLNVITDSINKHYPIHMKPLFYPIPKTWATKTKDKKVQKKNLRKPSSPSMKMKNPTIIIIIRALSHQTGGRQRKAKKKIREIHIQIRGLKRNPRESKWKNWKGKKRRKLWKSKTLVQTEERVKEKH